MATKRRRRDRADYYRVGAWDGTFTPTGRMRTRTFDVRDCVKRVLDLPSAKERRGDCPPGLPEIVVRRNTKRSPRLLGSAWPWLWKLKVTTWPTAPAVSLRSTIIHEVAHLLFPPGTRHTEPFRALLTLLRREWCKRYPKQPLRPDRYCNDPVQWNPETESYETVPRVQ